jgi:hypothetical protein
MISVVCLVSYVNDKQIPAIAIINYQLSIINHAPIPEYWRKPFFHSQRLTIENTTTQIEIVPKL